MLWIEHYKTIECHCHIYNLYIHLPHIFTGQLQLDVHCHVLEINCYLKEIHCHFLDMHVISWRYTIISYIEIYCQLLEINIISCRYIVFPASKADGDAAFVSSQYMKWGACNYFGNRALLWSS